MSAHGYQLRAPWYVRERGPFGLRDPRALRPEIQKYDTSEFVERVVADPRDSVRFQEDIAGGKADDLWSYPMPIPLGSGPPGRGRLATHALVYTGTRKLYQSSHQRFYVVVVELFCDTPGLPRAGHAPGVEVGFALRRQKLTVAGAVKDVRKLSRDLAVDLLATQRDQKGKEPDADVEDLFWADRAERKRFEADHADLFAAVSATTDEQAWMVTGSRGAWRDVGSTNGVPADEQVFRMWRLPVGDCDAARTRSLWFGVVPTYSADVDAAGVPKLDDRAIYTIRCFARHHPRGPGCPAQVVWSEPTREFRLAGFYDPDGTKNHRVTVKAPDLRTLAARAGRPAGPGGLRIVTPPGSQLGFDPDNGTPGSPGDPAASAGETCTFALELLMIVAMFVFSLFLPVVVFLFQLWWLLALRFCFPLPATTFTALEGYFRAGNDPGALPATDPDPTRPDQRKLDAVLGAKGSAARLGAAPQLQNDRTLIADIVAASNPAGAVAPAPSESFDGPPDPVCPVVPP